MAGEQLAEVQHCRLLKAHKDLWVCSSGRGEKKVGWYGGTEHHLGRWENGEDVMTLQCTQCMAWSIPPASCSTIP